MHATATRDDASHATARELALLAALIALANAPLLAGGAWLTLLFVPAHVSAGEWWRVATGPLVHVGLYHLALDAGAFLMLYHGLHEPARRWRLLAVAAAVLYLHRPVEVEPSGTICGHCSWQMPNGRFFGKVTEWPCPTAALLNPTEGES